MQESGEMYIETIYILCKEQSNVRSIDVAEKMGFSKPSVSRGVSILKREGYVTMDENGFLKLTKSGLELAEKIYERHTILTEALTKLGVSSDVAQQDACKMEHIISDETFEAFKKHMAK